MKRTTRLEQIEEILRDHPDGVRVVEISRRCGVGRRTIYRDLDTLQEMGLPIWQANGRYGISREEYLTTLPINLNEAFTLLWSLRLLAHQTEMAYPHAMTVLRKLHDVFPQELSEQISALRQSLPSNIPSPHYMEVVEKLTQAWADGLKVHIWYKRNNKDMTVQRVIAPHLIDTTPQGQLYMIGYDEKSREVRIINIQRITHIEVMSQTFRRLNINLKQYITTARELASRSNQFETIVLRFAPESTPMVVKNQWYPGEKVEVLEDSSCIYIAEVTDWKEMEKWVRSWGAEVEVIAPTEFRQAIAAGIRRTANLYG